VDAAAGSKPAISGLFVMMVPSMTAAENAARPLTIRRLPVQQATSELYDRCGRVDVAPNQTPPPRSGSRSAQA
jgi:hypothetical protein